ncbi:hypothetical protein AGMMS49975_10870 [Clostridia bacterium]|nr:hypothetical protein AGMMS49975_10870 [Clostridia bacterium]
MLQPIVTISGVKQMLFAVVAKGVLTNMDTANATATEIRRSTKDTFSLVDTIRKRLEVGIRDLLYAFDVLANANNLTPRGEYEAVFDWRIYIFRRR